MLLRLGGALVIALRRERKIGGGKAKEGSVTYCRDLR